MVASFLLALLGVLIAAAWRGLGRPWVEVIARSRVAQEASVAAAALARDFGGSLPDAPQGGRLDGAAVGRLLVGSDELWICFDGGTSPDGLPDWGPPDTVITYAVQSGDLVRSNQQQGTSSVVARHVDAWVLTDQGPAIQIQLTLSYRDWTRTFTIVAANP
jgi:hypothetical protein